MFDLDILKINRVNKSSQQISWFHWLPIGNKEMELAQSVKWAAAVSRQQGNLRAL